MEKSYGKYLNLIKCMTIFVYHDIKYKKSMITINIFSKQVAKRGYFYYLLKIYGHVEKRSFKEKYYLTYVYEM